MPTTSGHHTPKRRHVALFVAAAACVLGLPASGLLGTGGLRPVQAAPVPAAQASCPPPVDPRPVAANTTSYARIDGVPGDATATPVAGQIALSSVRTGLMAGGSGLCGAPVGRPALDPIVLEKRIDRASVPLLSRAARGVRIPAVRITVWTTGAAPRQLASYDLADVVIGSVRQLQRGDSLTEELTLSYGQITWGHTPTNPDGSAGAAIVFCFDVARSIAC